MRQLSTYAEWVSALEQFGKGDDSVLDDLEYGSFVLDAGTAARFYSRVEDVYKSRKKDWLDKFNRSFQVQAINNIGDFEILIRNAKASLIPLQRFTSSKGLPEELRATLTSDLNDFVSEIKQSLKNNVSKTTSNREQILIYLNSFGLFQMQCADHVSQKLESTSVSSGITGRKIIF